jgi:hypothetical protein
MTTQKSLKSVSKEPLERLFTRATERLQGNLLILHQNSPLIQAGPEHCVKAIQSWQILMQRQTSHKNIFYFLLPPATLLLFNLKNKTAIIQQQASAIRK